MRCSVGLRPPVVAGEEADAGRVGPGRDEVGGGSVGDGPSAVAVRGRDWDGGPARGLADQRDVGEPVLGEVACDTCTPGALAQQVMKSATGPLVMFQVPSPLANATGIVAHPGVCRTSAMSVRPFPLKSPVDDPHAGRDAQPVMKSATGPLVMFQVPSPLANATGIAAQPGVCRTSAMSVRPLPLKSPGDDPHARAAWPRTVMKSATGPLVTFQVPSPLANATGMLPSPASAAPARCRSARCR